MAIGRARAAGTPVSVITGGHNYAGAGLADDSLLVDLSGLRAITVTPSARTATAQVAVTNGQLDAVLARHGLAFPVGHSPTVPLGGYLLGGGLGWNSESWGKAACFSVTGADVLLANGQLVAVSESAEPELFWALRGAGPLFPGIVTCYTLELYPRPNVLQATRTYDLGSIDAVAGWIEDGVKRKSDRVELSTTFETCSSDPTETTRVVTVSAVAFCDRTEDGRRELEALLVTLPDTGVVATQGTHRTSIELLLEAGNDPPLRYAVETSWTDDAAATLRAITTPFVRNPAHRSIAHVAFRTEPELGPDRDAAYSVTGKALVFCAGAWEDEADDQRQLQWCDRITSSVSPLTVGRYINETDYVSHPGRIIESFSPMAMERLLAIRRHYDPDNVFSYPD
jgi:FAD/FMN-containing dehydrogenase